MSKPYLHCRQCRMGDATGKLFGVCSACHAAIRAEREGVTNPMKHFVSFRFSSTPDFSKPTAGQFYPLVEEIKRSIVPVRENESADSLNRRATDIVYRSLKEVVTVPCRGAKEVKNIDRVLEGTCIPAPGGGMKSGFKLVAISRTLE